MIRRRVGVLGLILAGGLLSSTGPGCRCWNVEGLLAPQNRAAQPAGACRRQARVNPVAARGPSEDWAAEWPVDEAGSDASDCAPPSNGSRLGKSAGWLEKVKCRFRGSGAGWCVFCPPWRGADSGGAPNGVQEHSRFHPVPTHPVFSPRSDCSPLVSLEAGPIGSAFPADQPGGPTMRLDPAPPPPPEQLPPPKAEEKPEKLSMAPRRLDSPSSGRGDMSWIFIAPPRQDQAPPLVDALIPQPPQERGKAAAPVRR